jgi:hypothetical protein
VTDLLDFASFGGCWPFRPRRRGETNDELLAAADRRRPIRLDDLAGLLTPESRNRFTLPSVRNHPPEIEPGNKCCEWNDEDGRSYGIYREGTDWVITQRASSNAHNRLHIRSPHWENVCIRALDVNIRLPPEFKNYGIEHP